MGQKAGKCFKYLTFVERMHSFLITKFSNISVVRKQFFRKCSEDDQIPQITTTHYNKTNKQPPPTHTHLYFNPFVQFVQQYRNRKQFFYFLNRKPRNRKIVLFRERTGYLSFLIFTYIVAQLINNAVLVSGVDRVIQLHIYMYPFSNSFPIQAIADY